MNALVFAAALVIQPHIASKANLVSKQLIASSISSATTGSQVSKQLIAASIASRQGSLPTSANMAASPDVDDSNFVQKVLTEKSKPVIVAWASGDSALDNALDAAHQQLRNAGLVQVYRARLEELPRLRAWLLMHGLRVDTAPACTLFVDGHPKSTLRGTYEIRSLSQFISKEMEKVPTRTPSTAWARHSYVFERKAHDFYGRIAARASVTSRAAARC
eukprot:CAMPEP_0181252698 /NCGR_PEP_ID=MMETSP1096-20121128/47608_1 /TAXON_ID=156174 ORGANISM="Chrysochromulina ericina, Strain CCMP281" /NCGR_SAMPLE_ID=MMETSP1096 /ASSEMBLY_ACC=CAM_ASM_000453 /LENGTH=217 /DNA_ID=CAMNT_0023350483 /DNA_START=56 /DNA_END=709 /DNA_ORIENTATION=+